MRGRRHLAVLMLTTAVFACPTARAVEPEKTSPSPRIAVRDGRFVSLGPAGRAEPFHPRGFNYVRLDEGRHYTFSDAYDARKAQAALDDMARHGFNIVRVFVSMNRTHGVAGDVNATELSPAYLDRACDFLARARRAGLHVIFAMEGPPICARYRQIAHRDGPPPFEGTNLKYLYGPAQDAKAQYMADFAIGIAQRDRSLLSTVFAYELENETFFSMREPPFNASEGTYELNGRSYDLADEADLQRLADDGIKMTADKCVAAVKKVDPDAMVSADVFTFQAVRRTGPGHLRTDQTRDRRFPARPLALVDTQLAYIDIHFYSSSGYGLATDLQSIEWEQFAPAAKKAGKPIIMGEFGAFKGRVESAEQAVELLVPHVRRVMDLGVAGWLLWTYDTDEQTGIWNAKMDDDTLLKALADVRTYGIPTASRPSAAAEE